VTWTFRCVAQYPGTTEGAAWDGVGLVFTHISSNSILRYDPRTGECVQLFADSRATNGLAVDWRGDLYGCRAADHCIARYGREGTVTPLPNLLDGVRHNRPNSLVVDRRGRIWFSDTFGRSAPREERTLPHASVLRLTPASEAEGGYRLERMTFDTATPSGILLSRDERTLYLAESSLEGPVRELRAYPLQDDDTLGAPTVLHTFGRDRYGVHRGVDGMVLDVSGNIVACAGWKLAGPGPMVYVFDPTGRILETHPVPADRPTSCTFGGPDFGTLYVTTAGFPGSRAPTAHTPQVSGGYLFEVTDTGRRGWLPLGAIPE
jgi:gluconolactonase